MGGPEYPAGWYPDPSDRGRLRWWDGRRWTSSRSDGDAEPPPQRFAWARRQLVAGAVLGGFLLVSAGVVIALVIADDGPSDDLAIEDRLFDESPDDPGAAEGDGPDEATAPEAPGDGGVDDPLDDGGEGEDPGASDDPDVDGADADGTDGEDGSGDGEDGSGDAEDAEPSQVDFDGVCAVDVDPQEVDDPQQLRPWQFAECELAPVGIDGADGRWIVVVASFSGDGLTAEEARERADGAGRDLLWSSHYPSLNPDLWVLFDGPFDDEDAATDAADAIGGGSYPRVLSDDDGDRYCIADDGCVGGTPS